MFTVEEAVTHLGITLPRAKALVRLCERTLSPDNFASVKKQFSRWHNWPGFEGEDFSGSPMHADDSDPTVASLLLFLSLRPGDTDQEYFESYTQRQLEWCQEFGEELWSLAHELEEGAENLG